MARRRRLPVELTDDAHAGLDALATRHHVTKTAMLEVLGQHGLAGRSIVWEDIITEARDLDQERRSRT